MALIIALLIGLLVLAYLFFDLSMTLFREGEYSGGVISLLLSSSLLLCVGFGVYWYFVLKI